ncbi:MULTISPECIES: MFS transporter [Leptolyngbya]|uniref:MFS transporter n=1 Tax=Leptolyngbya TaxID=47251 RepID=UPI00168854F9|nr:MFS transporter [Leptolyngbya sp. FACHB-1624]
MTFKFKLFGSAGTDRRGYSVEPLPITPTPAHITESPEPITGSEAVFPLAAMPESRFSKSEIRSSLRASTLDGIFAAVFSNIAGGVLLSNFLVELHASPVEIGLSASIPMMANLLQPLGAWLGDRTTSRHNYCLAIYTPSRLIWLLLPICIGLFTAGKIADHTLVLFTLAIVFCTHFLGALGGASWLSWLASLVPRRLRGRYFSIRNSAANLTCLISVPLGGFLVSKFATGSILGYGVILVFGIVAGILSLGFQWFMNDVNPQEQQKAVTASDEIATDAIPLITVLKDANFVRFLIYFSVWMFAVNLSAPFFNLYLLDNLGLDVSWVTIYSSLTSAANLLMLVFWGRIADRVGNRFLLLSVGVLVAATPIFWLGTGTDLLSLWLWLPLLHILAGGTWAAIDLCNNNIQLEIAPLQNQSTYFALAAAIAGVSGALGTTAGGFLAELANYGGLPGLFVISTIVRFVALAPLIWVQERGGRSVRQVLRSYFAKDQVDLQLSEKS